MTTALTVLVITLVVTQIAVITTSIYLHRGLAHRALRFHPVADVVFRTLLWLTRACVGGSGWRFTASTTRSRIVPAIPTARVWSASGECKS